LQAPQFSCTEAAASMASAMELISANTNGWGVEQYATETPCGGKFTHLVLANRHGRQYAARDVWIRFHGSDVVVFDEQTGMHRELMRAFSQSVPWILDSGDPDTLYTFVSTETGAYGGYFHDLCQDECLGVNVDYPLGDWGYAMVGCEQTKRHLQRLAGRGYVPGVSRVTSVGYSDGGYLSSMNALTGVTQSAVAWGGWVFARFDEWRRNLPVDAAGRSTLRGMRLDAFISAGDPFYNGSHPLAATYGMGPPESDASMLGGLRAIASFLRMDVAPSEEVFISGARLVRTVFFNLSDDNVIALHVDPDPAHDHAWLFHQEGLLSATSRVAGRQEGLLSATSRDKVG
jgi:hypothetical protein